jgi:hypothetical protein
MAAQLEWLQQAFAEALCDAAYEERLLPHVKRASDSTALNMTRSGTHMPSDFTALQQRLGLYRGNVRGQWRAALANAYPVLNALTGDEYFDALSFAYARAHPSQSGDLHRFGAELPRFVEDYEQNPRFRYFADVARLEWSLHVAYFAADVASFSSEQWLEIGEERLLDMRLAVHPACTAISSRYAIADIWLAHQPGGTFPESMEMPTRVLTIRPEWRPTILVHSDAAYAAFMALHVGKTLNHALDAAFELDPAFDFPSQWQSWITSRAVTGVML